MFFTKMAIRFLASAAFVLSYMGSSYGQCPNFTLKLEQPNANVPVYDVVLETPPGGLQNIVTLNIALNFGAGATDLEFSNVHPQLNSTNMSVNELMRTISFFQINTNLSFTGPEEHLFSVSFDGPIGTSVQVTINTLSQIQLTGSGTPFCPPTIEDSPQSFFFQGLSVEGFIEQDGGIPCSGSVDNGIPGVTLRILAGGGGSADCGSIETDNQGEYNCAVFKPGGNYRIKPEKNNNKDCGISTLDLALLHKHLIMTESLDEYQELVAADLNTDGVINLADRIILQSIIVGNTSQLIHSWRFFQTYDYGLMQSPAAFTYNLSGLPLDNYIYNNLQNDKINTDFVGIKLGDINGNCADCAAPMVRPNDRLPVTANRPLEIFIPRVEMKKGQEYLIPVKVKNQTEALFLFSLGLEINSRYGEIMGVESGDLNGISEDNFNMETLRNGKIRSIWTSDSHRGTVFSANSTIFYVRVVAKQSISNSNGLFSIDHSYMDNQAFSMTDEVLAIELTSEGSSDFSVFPNPFSSHLTFQLPRVVSGPLSLKIYDGAGRLIKMHEESFVSEDWSWTWIPDRELSNGIYFYQIDVGISHYEGRIVKSN